MQHERTKILAEGAVMTALATVLSFIRIFRLPWGGSVTLLSMLPIVIFSIRRGFRWGLVVSFVYALIQFAQSVIDGIFGWGLTPGMLAACILLDYIGAFFVLGLAGLFREKRLSGWIGGIVLAVGLRYLMHVASGAIVWHSIGTLWESFSTDNTWLYSLLYNGCYMLPEMVFTLAGAMALLKLPQSRRLILEEIR